MSFYQEIIHHRVRNPVARVETEGPDCYGVYQLKLIHEDGSIRMAYCGRRTMALFGVMASFLEEPLSGIKGLKFDEATAAEIILP